MTAVDLDENQKREIRRSRKAAQYAANRDELRARANARYHANKADISAKKRLYYLKRKSALIAAARKWNEENPESKRRNNLAWQKANPENARTHARNRAARIRAADGFHTSDEIDKLFRKQRGRCANPACLASIENAYHADHVKPLSKGGSNWIENIQLLCPPCNFRKGSKDPVVWANEIGGLLNDNRDRQPGRRTVSRPHQIDEGPG